MDKIKRNKKKILIGAAITLVVAGGVFVGYKYFTVRPEVLEAAEAAGDAAVTLAKSGK